MIGRVRHTWVGGRLRYRLPREGQARSGALAAARSEPMKGEVFSR
jgi:hypothetical protein